ncbi:MAG: trimethylamine methyltransferase family protein [Deltaproteobacteria bacterium]|nr:trimethylamine methyltransferase family protein [Deltaproteobacteria bacterium]
MTKFSLNGFSDENIDLIHQATLAILEKTGIRVESREAVEIFQGSGAGVEKDDHGFRVKFSPALVEECVRFAPGTITLYGRDPRYDITLEKGRSCFTLFGENINVIDPYSQKLRACTKKDLGQATRVADALDEIAIVEKCMGSHEKPAQTQSLHNYEAMVTNTGKHVLHGFFSAENTKKIVDMAAACAGGMDNFKKRPCVTAVVCPTSPLTLVQQCCEVIIETARSGVGICCVTMPLSGTTSPATLAGTLVLQNAELLSALVLTQLAAKHTPFIYGSCATIMDLKIGNPAMGAPENGMLSVGTAKLAQYYDIPSWCGSGITGSKLPDAQAAYEFALNTSLSVLAGANILFCCGGIEYGLTFDYAKLIMDTEHIKSLNMAAGGLDVSDNSLALDVIESVGPGGEFLTHPHTMAHMRSMSSGGLFDRASREIWVENTEGRSITERSYEKARQILETHQALPLPDGAADLMASIIQDSENERG